MADTPDNSAPPSYQEAVLYPADSKPPGADVGDPDPENATVTSSLSTSTSSSRAQSASNVGQPSVPGILNLTIASLESGSGRQVITQSSLDAPAIIIHSALSSPGSESLEVVSPLDQQLQEFNGQQLENHHVVDFSTPGNTSDRTTDLGDDHHNFHPRAGKDETDSSGVTPGNVNSAANQNSSAVVNEMNNQQTVSAKPYLGCRRGIGVGNNLAPDDESDVKVNEVQVDVHDRGDDQSSARLRGETTALTTFDSYDYSEKKSHFRNIAKNNGKSSSLDEGWSDSSATDRLLDDDDMGPIGRPRVSTLEGSTSPTRYTKHTAGRNVPSPKLAPGVSKMSKSYNDLSSRHRVCRHEGCCNHSDGGSSQGSTQHTHHQHPGQAGSHCKHNRSSNNIHRTGDHSRCHRNHLLPESRNLQGTRGMRSVSENDLRMRSGTDEYTWKDGKVQLKNGGMSHGESVRYVWKDGHVEKITTDANNEDTQVEILEPTDNKTCSKINPIFVCIFLIGLIAVVIILPVYFAS